MDSIGAGVGIEAVVVMVVAAAAGVVLAAWGNKLTKIDGVDAGAAAGEPLANVTEGLDGCERTDPDEAMSAGKVDGVSVGRCGMRDCPNDDNRKINCAWPTRLDWHF